MAAYYNEFEPYAAEWLRKLVAAGQIAAGDVDERSIVDVDPSDLRGYTQCHFFAGIGGWSYALRLAGWSDDRFVWTGSCPCQPFSAAGAQRGHEDERHLWPAFFRLIRECRPATVFGEQVAGAAGLAWLDHVCADLEGEGYAAAAADLPAASVGAPHRRQRLFWVAHANGRHAGAEGIQRGREQRQQPQDSGIGIVANAERRPAERQRHDVAAAPRDAEGQTRQRQRLRDDAGAVGIADGVGDSNCANGSRLRSFGIQVEPEQETRRSSYANPWAEFEFIGCADGKARPTQPGLFPLAHGVPNRVGRLRAYGNAIIPQVAAEFIGAYLNA